MEDPLAEKRGRFLALTAGLPARLRLIEVSEGNRFLRKLKKLRLFGPRYVRWAAAQAGLRPGIVDVPLFWGKTIRLPYSDTPDFVTFYLAGAPGGPEHKLARWFIRTLKPSDSFYDAGANLGFYTMLALEFTSEVHAFEPVPEIHAWLAANAVGAHAVNAALWDRTGEATLFRHRLSDVLGTLEAEVARFDERGEDKLAVRCTTLDDYVKASRPPTVLKIDVEGGEKRLLAGAEKTLRDARPVVSMEVWAGAGGEKFSLPAVRTLLAFGYAAHALDDQGNLVALPADRVDAFILDLPGWDNLVFLPSAARPNYAAP